MGVILEDLNPGRPGERAESLRCNWWSWRPSLALLRASEVVTDLARLELLGANAGQPVSEAEARAFALHLAEVVLPALRPGERLRLDLSSTAEPDDGTFYREPDELHLNYSATYEWLTELEAFCRECAGFKVC